MDEMLREKFYDCYPELGDYRDLLSLYNDCQGRTYCEVLGTQSKVRIKNFDNGGIPVLKVKQKEYLLNLLQKSGTVVFREHRIENEKNVDYGNFFFLYPRLEPYREYITFSKDSNGEFRCRVKDTLKCIHFRELMPDGITPYLSEEDICRLYTCVRSVHSISKLEEQMWLKQVLKAIFRECSDIPFSIQIDKDMDVHVSYAFTQNIVIRTKISWEDNRDALTKKIKNIFSKASFTLDQNPMTWQLLKQAFCASFPCIQDTSDQDIELFRTQMDQNYFHICLLCNGKFNNLPKKQIKVKIKNRNMAEFTFFGCTVRIEKENCKYLHYRFTASMTKEKMAAFSFQYKTILRVAESYRTHCEKINAIPGGNLNLVINFSKDAVIGVSATDNGKQYHVDTDAAHLKSSLGKISKEIIADRKARVAEQKRIEAIKEKEKKEKYKKIILSSCVYGNILTSEILQFIDYTETHYCGYYASETKIYEHCKKIHGSLKKEEITKLLNAMWKEKIVHTAYVDGKYQSYDRYCISDPDLCGLFSSPKPLHYGKDKRFAEYTDTDWLCLLEKEDSSTLTTKDWEKRLPILDHSLVLEVYVDHAKDYFQYAPEEIVAYIQMVIKDEPSRLKNSVLRNILSEEQNIKKG